MRHPVFDGPRLIFALIACWASPIYYLRLSRSNVHLSQLELRSIISPENKTIEHYWDADWAAEAGLGSLETDLAHEVLEAVGSVVGPDTPAGYLSGYMTSLGMGSVTCHTSDTLSHDSPDILPRHWRMRTYSRTNARLAWFLIFLT